MWQNSHDQVTVFLPNLILLWTFLFAKSWAGLQKFTIDQTLCACACVSLGSDSSETVEVNIVKLGTVTASFTRMHHVLILLTLPFIQGHTDRHHEHNKGSIMSDTIQAMPTTFAVQIVRLKVHMTIAGPMTLTFIQGHKCVSNLTTFLTYNISDNNYVSYYSQTWHEGRLMDAIILTLVLMSKTWPGSGFRAVWV